MIAARAFDSASAGVSAMTKIKTDALAASDAFAAALVGVASMSRKYIGMGVWMGLLQRSPVPNQRH